MRVAELGKVRLEFRRLVFGHIDAGEHAAVVRTVIAVMEQADVLVGADRVEKFEQGPGALRKFETKKTLVADAA